MPWTELKPRKFPAFDKQLDGISRQTSGLSSMPAPPG